MESLFCPGCDALIGSAADGVPVQCWKCGVVFGQQASTKPISREPLAPSWLRPVQFYAVLFAPRVMRWGIHQLDRIFPIYVPSRVAGLGLLGGVIVWVGCTVFCLDRLLKWERGFSWLIALVFFVLFTLSNFLVVFFG